ncbi:hypothetical protein M0R72_11000 [Candidatus Pacearchaeota archaeon]|jgi:hypothetical protein|nr:hypothetical protein [Candidatus Pacearchaeota archaeon]
MRKLLIFLMAFMVVGAASGLPMLGPSQGFRNPGNVEIGGSLSVGGANIVAGSITYDDITQAAYANETAINSSIDALTLAAYTNETDINSSLSALTIAAYTNETAINTTLAALPGSIIDAEYGLKNESGVVIVNLTANDGLEFGTGATLGALGVKTGDGLDTGATGVLVDATDIINTGEGLYESSENNIAINLTEDGGLGFGLGADSGALIVYPYSGLKTTSNGLELNYTADKGLEIGTGADEGALQIELDGSTLSAGASGLKVTDDTFASKTVVDNVVLGQTAQNNTLANLALGQTYQNTTLTNNALALTAINTSIDALVVPMASFDYDANSVDQAIFTASGGWVLTAVVMTPRVVASSGDAVTVMVKICDSGEAPASGDNMLSGTLSLKNTVDTHQSGTVSAGTIATGKIVALDFTGDLTAAVGTITLYGTRA